MHTVLTFDPLNLLCDWQALHVLQRLVLYYNAIAESVELAKLSFHPQLSMLDMRLNPVSTTDACGVGVEATSVWITLIGLLRPCGLCKPL